MSDKPKVGGNVDSFCTRCKMELAHTVVAMVGDRGVQATCTTCHSFHRYRATPAGKKSVAASTGKTRGTRTVGNATKAASTPAWERQWHQQVEQSGEKEIAVYRMVDGFAQGDVIQHKSFGIGVVQQILEPQKMTALFKGGMRTLAMNR